MILFFHLIFMYVNDNFFLASTSRLINNLFFRLNYQYMFIYKNIIIEVGIGK